MKQKKWITFALCAAPVTGFSQLSTNGIAEIPASNPIVTTPPTAPNLSEERALLQELARSTNHMTRQKIEPLSTNHIFSLAPAEHTESEDAIATIIENARLQEILRTTQEKEEQGDTLGAITNLTAQLNSFTLPESTYTIQMRLGLLYYNLKDFQRAVEAMQAANRAKPGQYNTLSNIAAMQLFMGEIDAAIATLNLIDETLLLNNPNTLFTYYFNFSCAYSLREETEAALTYLEKAAKAFPQRAYISLSDPMLDNIRNTPKFNALAQTLQRIIE